MLRVWPIICQFGIGAILCLIGIFCSLRGGYLNIRIAEDRRFIVTLIIGYVLLLCLACFFTFLAPYWANGGIT